MQRKMIIGLLIFVGLVKAAMPGYGAGEAREAVTAESIYKNLYIGEVLGSGFIYIEPFAADRETVGKAVNFSGYPKRIKFYPLDQDQRVKFYEASFESVFQTYVPKIEESGIYFSQPFSQPEQSGLRYKTHLPPKKTQSGIAFFDLELLKIDYRVKGKKRPYSNLEYQRAQEELKKDQEIEESDRTLQFMKLDNTIIGAKQILTGHCHDTQLTIRLSKYLTHTSEYAAEVYVFDVLKDNKVIKTYEKHNWDGPY
jgi:hypothetical protein